MLYTGKGDKGDTTHPAVGKRVSKTDPVIEALGSVDELNAWVGLCRVKASQGTASVIASEAKQSDTHGVIPSRVEGSRHLTNNLTFSIADILHQVQQHLFIIQAELVGMKKLEGGKVQTLESWITVIEEELPPITSFFLPGGTELSAMLDVARTVCRRAERAVVRLHEVFAIPPRTNPYLLAYLNRLSSLLYALTRLVNHRAGIVEEQPSY
jgi:cob(I)alamin adenosyltransferase